MLDLIGLDKLGPTAVTIGVFDGVHRGHQLLLSELARLAAQSGLSPTVVVVHPPPRPVLAGQDDWQYVTDLEYRAQLLKQCGAENVVVLNFTRQVSLIDAHTFCKLLVDNLQMRLLVAGPDFALGHNREGVIPRLREIGSGAGFTVETIEPVQLNDRPVSTTAVRVAVQEGRVADAQAIMGRYFQLSGQVAPGDRRGRLIGFPTANLILDSRQLMPADGVYAVFAQVGEQTIPSVANYGERPTFAGTSRLLEAHLLDFEGDLYGERLTVAFVERIRAERRFAGIDELRKQIAADVSRARQILAAQLSGRSTAE